MRLDDPTGAPIGHEFLGVVEQIGADVHSVACGDLVVAPFNYCDGTCVHCRAGWTSSCSRGCSRGLDGGQCEAVRVPFADGTLVRIPGFGHSDGTLRSLLTLTDVMCTGHHAAVSAGVKPGGVSPSSATEQSGCVPSLLCAAPRCCPDSCSRPAPARQALGRLFGATEMVAERGDAATQAVLKLTDGVGADAVLECVGTGQSMATALGVVRHRWSGRLRRGPAWRRDPGQQHLLPQRRRTRGPVAVAHLLPSCSTTLWRVKSSPGGSSTSRPISTTSRRRVPRLWTNHAPSSSPTGPMPCPLPRPPSGAVSRPRRGWAVAAPVERWPSRRSDSSSSPSTRWWSTSRCPRSGATSAAA